MSENAPIIFPKTTQEGTQNFLSKWLKKVGDTVALHEPIAEVSTDKAIIEIASPANGFITELFVKENQEITPGDTLGTVSLSATLTEKAPLKVAPVQSAKAAAAPALELSPAVKKLLKDHNLDPHLIEGSGRGGRITPEDVEKFLASKNAAPSIDGHKIPHTAMRKTIAKHLADSLLKTAPHVTTIFECDHTAVLEHKSRFEAQQDKITLTAYYVYALAQGVKAAPEVNSRWFDDYLEIYNEVNVGIGTATKDGGLIVPVIKNVEKLSLGEIAKKMNDLISRARDNNLAREETIDGTITISNYGMSGGMVAMPIIIHQPQSAILGVGKLEKRAKVISQHGKDTIEIRPCAFTTLTIDHRVLDGFKANAFMSAFVKALEEIK